MKSNFKKLISDIFVSAVAVSFLAARFALPRFTVQAHPAQSIAPREELRAFAAIEPIDTHVHAFKSDPEFTDLMSRLRLHLLDICVADNHGIYGELGTELARAQGFVASSQGHARLCVRIVFSERVTARTLSNSCARNLPMARSP